MTEGLTAAQRLTQAGLEVVELPSGFTVRGVLPTVEHLWLRGVVPMDLQAVAMRFQAGGTLDDLPKEEQQHWYRFLRLLVAHFVREVRVDEGAWEPASLSVEDTETMAPEDVDELEYIVLRTKTCRQVSATTMYLRGHISEAELQAIVEAEMPKTVGGWATFRHFIGVDRASRNSQDVRENAQSTVRPNRASRRARARRRTCHTSSG